MQRQIKRFLVAQSAYDKAAKALGKALQPHFDKANTLVELQSLLMRLPPSYMGRRFIYEKIYRIQDKAKKRS